MHQQTQRPQNSLALLIEQATLDREQPLRSAMLVTLIDGVGRVCLAERRKRHESKPFAKCHCCGRQYTQREFQRLPLASGGTHQFDGVALVRYRNCHCGSTIATGIVPGRNPRGAS